MDPENGVSTSLRQSGCWSDQPSSPVSCGGQSNSALEILGSESPYEHMAGRGRMITWF